MNKILIKLNMIWLVKYERMNIWDWKAICKKMTKFQCYIEALVNWTCEMLVSMGMFPYI
jgi:hypothetical protein